MTEQSNADLIAEARGIDFEWVLDNSPEDSVETIRDLADALESADQRAAELAAVVEKVRDYLEEGKGAYAPDLLDILATAPADALREVKADVWDEGYGYSLADVKREARNPYRQAKRVLMTHPHDGHDLGDTCLDCQRREEQS